MVPVILSGGAGNRLWPLSRSHYPKQFLNLVDECSLFQQTIMRLQGMLCDSPIVVCNEEHRFLVAEQLRTTSSNNIDIILEPVSRNTAPAVAIAAFHALTKDDDAILLVLPSDHIIQDINLFHSALSKAEGLARQDKLVTFGVIPDKAATGYGYIKRGRILGTDGYEVDSFVEKPNIETAQSFLDSGEYFWNSGIFMFKASRYLNELKKFQPEIFSLSEVASDKMDKSFDFIRLDEEAYTKCPADSIDYAVMENTKSAVVVPLNAQWSDIGSWSALWETNVKDDNNNVVIGDVVNHGVTNSYIHSSSKLVTAVGVDNLIIVDTADAILVVSRDRDQDVKLIVERLKKSKRQEVIHHKEVLRPWGSYESIDSGNGFLVKRVIVKAGASLSLQVHHYRAEHWIVVKGKARVTKEDEVFTLSENESTFIPLGIKHKLENVGVVPLEIIEVQSGSYLGEDDIVRFEDTYGRK